LSIPFSIFFFVLFDKNIKVCYSSLNTNWRCAIKRKIIVGFLSLALILFLVIPTACVAKRDTDSSPASSSSSSIEQDITTLRKDVKDLQSKIASLPTSSGSNYDADIEALQSDIDNIYTEIESLNDELYSVLDEIETMLADWEEEQQVEEEISGDVYEDVRWEFDDDVTIIKSAYQSTDISEDLVAFVTAPIKRIEEGTYDVEVTIETTSSYLSGRLGFELMLETTKHDDYVAIDEKKTELYSVGSSRLDWVADFFTKDELCRRIYFESDAEDFSIATLLENANKPSIYYYQLDLVLELAYK